MQHQDVECLRCGQRHRLEHVAWQHVQESECPRCGYLGWMAVEDDKPKSKPLRPADSPGLRVAG
jgi:DNA-directed RNA polymerase subunit RPC12/RpoP